jgi:Arc/MetJ-type ribon-helix-helix transcriptional regulator
LSGYEDELKRLKAEVERCVDGFLRRIGEVSSRVSEIEGRVGVEKDSSVLWEFLKELKGLKREVRRELAEARGSLVGDLKGFRDRLREASTGEPGLARGLKEGFEDLREFFEDRLDEAEDRLDEFLDRVGDVEDVVRDRIRELKGAREREAYVVKLRVPGGEVKVPDVGRIVEESISKAWSGVPSTIVSSVRLPKTDLDLIDALVEAGVFRSRNEGIVFFAHKGIEASGEWLSKAREKLEEIKRLREETKREMERMLGEASGRGEEKKD